MKKAGIIQWIVSYILLNAVVTTVRGQQHYNSFDGIAQRSWQKE